MKALRAIEGVAFVWQREGSNVRSQAVLDLLEILAVGIELPGAIGVLTQVLQLSPWSRASGLTGCA
jgi:hypothetical protein